MDKLILVTYENEDTPEFQFLEKTAKKNGWNIMRIGFGEKWLGFTNKINGYREICDKVSDDTIIVFSDARDVVCLRPPNAFKDAYEYMKSDIIVSAEVVCEGKLSVPDDYEGKQCVSLHPYYKYHIIKPHSIRKFVNSGLIAGKANALRHMWQWIIDQKIIDDQLGVGMYMNAFPMNIKLDCDAELLHSSTFGINGGVYSIHQQKHDAPSYSELFGCGAFFLHIPGNRTFKGQRLLYEVVKKHLEMYDTYDLLKLYDAKIPSWDQYDDLKKK
jgi:hypothetical protein